MNEIGRKVVERWTEIGNFLNPPNDPKRDEAFRDLAREMLIEFSDVSDYIWKTPNFVEHEKIVEAEKLRAYFPLTGDAERDRLAEHLRACRWEHESRKLLTVFPNMMVSGNLFLCLAIFESYCLRVVKLIEKRSGLSLKDCKGRGTSRIFAFFLASGIRPFDLSHAKEMQIALRIRNCLIHAEGLLELDKDEKALRRIVRKGTYLSASHLERRQQLGRAPDEVSIIAGELGDRIKITNDYPHIITRYARDFLTAACRQAHDMFAISKCEDENGEH